MNTSQCLPPELTVQSVEEILHRIGLTLDSTKSYPKRKLFFNPIIIFIFCLMIITKEVFILTLDEQNDLTFKVLGSVGYFLGIRKQYSFPTFLISFFPISFQLIYYYNYRNGIKPTFLRVFQMMSGLVSPKSIGLTDEVQIRKLLKLTKFLTKYLELNSTRIVPVSPFTFIITIYMINTNLMETVCYGLPNAINYSILAIYALILISYHVFLQYIICLYLKIKINALNERLIEMKRRKRFIRIRETLQSFDSLYSEINEYNTTFWSKILFIFWTLLGTIIVFVFYICIFSKVDSIALFIFEYILIVLVFSFLFIIFTTSSVTYCANKSYKTLNSLFISYSKHNKHLFWTRIYNRTQSISKHYSIY